jgi:hypothetical protein
VLRAVSSTASPIGSRVDTELGLTPREIKTAIRVPGAPAVLAMDDADMYGAELSKNRTTLAANHSNHMESTTCDLVLERVPLEYCWPIRTAAEAKFVWPTIAVGVPLTHHERSKCGNEYLTNTTSGHYQSM